MLNAQYRPTRFCDVIGRDNITLPLRYMITSNTVARNLLFHGHHGTGKTTIARILAKALNCSNLQECEPCGTCEYCQDSSLFVEWDVPMRNKVEDVEEITEITQYAVEEGKHRVILLDEAHQFSAAAWEKLHKTLEEDSLTTLGVRDPNIFILGTTKPQMIPSPIRSRCLEYHFPELTKSELTLHLKRVAALEGITAPEEALQAIAAISFGDARNALSELEKLRAVLGASPDRWLELMGYASPDLLKEFMVKLWKKDYTAVKTLIEILETAPVVTFLQQLHPYLMEAVKSGQDPEFWAKVFDAYYKAINAGSAAAGIFITMVQVALLQK